MAHFTKNKILTSVQHGFRAEHSCDSQLLLTTEDLVQNYEDKIQTDIIVLDFSKAFDVVPHQRLIHRLDHYEIRGPTLPWIQNFLCYINDLPFSVSSDVRLFAEDCLLYRPIRIKADQEKLQEDLTNLER